jgi:predicted HAD superfamily Cof-like phosphohydrolase
MSNYYADVGEFHRKFDIPAYDPRRPCEFPSEEILRYRMLFLREELTELDLALESKNLIEALDALADIAYVAMGTAHYFNAPFQLIWGEIQRANMERVKCTRENCPPDKQYRVDMVIKPPDWRPPQIGRILDTHNAFARKMSRRAK